MTRRGNTVIVSEKPETTFFIRPESGEPKSCRSVLWTGVFPETLISKRFSGVYSPEHANFFEEECF